MPPTSRAQNARETGHPGDSYLRLPVSAEAFLHSGEQTHETTCGQVAGEEATAFSGGVQKGFSGHVSTAHGAFHGRGPSCGSPVASKEDARPGCCGHGAMRVDARARGVSSVDFFDDGGFYERGSAGSREEFADLGDSHVDDLGAGFVDERLR